MQQADLVQFTGGSDVCPDFYLRLPHRETSFNMIRDHEERQIFIQTLALGIPMAGICRGGQFLNVMCGGRLWQHVNNHSIMGTHPIRLWNGEVIQGTSTHHQMMVPSREGIVVGTADICTRKETISKDGQLVVMNPRNTEDLDVEAVYYEKQQVFCFQPHPEFQGYEKLGDTYLGLVRSFLFS